jgi:DNA-directed RNA polymerase specialized sigma24 family protein
MEGQNMTAAVTKTTNDQASPETVTTALNILISDLSATLAAIDRIEDAEQEMAAHARSAQVAAQVAGRQAANVADAAGCAAGEVRRSLEHLRQCRSRVTRLAGTIEDAQQGRQ